MTIDRCRSSGFLIMVPCTLNNCKITNCGFGVTICNKIKGDVILENCVITRCKEQVSRFPGAVKPIIKGNNLRCSSHGEAFQLEEDTLTMVPCINLGRNAHEQSLMLQRFLSGKESMLSCEMAARVDIGCAYCTQLPFIDKHKYFMCKKCNAVMYCSLDCWKKDEDGKGHACAKTRRDIDAYRESINWQNTYNQEPCPADEGALKGNYEIPADSEGSKANIRNGRKYRGRDDMLLTEPHIRKYANDIITSGQESPKSGLEIEKEKDLSDETQHQPTAADLDGRNIQTKSKNKRKKRGKKGRKSTK